MSVIWEAGARFYAEMVQHEEWAEVTKLRSANRSSDACASALGLLDSQEDLPDRLGNGHVGCSRCGFVSSVVGYESMRFEAGDPGRNRCDELLLLKEKHRKDGGNDARKENSFHRGRPVRHIYLYWNDRWEERKTQ